MTSPSSFNTTLAQDSFDTVCQTLNDCQTRHLARRQKLIVLLRQWWLRARQRASLRRQLMEMDVALIERDIGVPSGSLQEEASKPFWRD